MERAQSPEDLRIFQLQERLRLHTQFVRNWGFFKRVIRISKALYEPLDAYYERGVGISATEIITVFERLVRKNEKDTNIHVRRLRPVRRARSVGDAVPAYFDMLPETEGSPDDLIDWLDDQGASVDDVWPLILSHADLRLLETFVFSSDDLASGASLPAERVQRALDALSHLFGDLSEKDPCHFFLTNPVWTRPAIRLEHARYFCPMPQLFFSFIFRILDGLLADDEKARAACVARRSDFLEEETAALFRAAFPGCEPIRNYEWSESGVPYETDLLLPIDSHLIIVEAKSGCVSLPALRGAPARARKHIKELIIDLAIQSERLATKLLKMRVGPENTPDLLHPLPFDLQSIRTIVRLSVTLEDFATIQSNL